MQYVHKLVVSLLLTPSRYTSSKVFLTLVIVLLLCLPELSFFNIVIIPSRRYIVEKVKYFKIDKRSICVFARTDLPNVSQTIVSSKTYRCHRHHEHYHYHYSIIVIASII